MKFGVAFAKSDFKSWDSSAIEKTHLQFCKRYLEVHNKASNIACRAELGKFPLNIDINKKILKYLKCYYDQKITFIFSSDFETMFVKHSPSEIISVNFEKKTVNLNCNFPV